MSAAAPAIRSLISLENPFFEEKLSQQAVALLIECSFTRTTGMAKIAFYLEFCLDFLESEKFFSPVIS